MTYSSNLKSSYKGKGRPRSQDYLTGKDRVLQTRLVLYVLLAVLCSYGVGSIYRDSRNKINSILISIEQKRAMDDVCRELISPLPKVQFVAQAHAEEIKPTPTPEPKTDREKMLAYVHEKFGERADDAIKMLETCENRGLNPKIVSPLNIQKSGRRSYDVGLFQINVDEHNTAEQEKLKDWKYNTDRAYAKYSAKGNKFTAWTCAPVIGEKNYLGRTEL